MAPPRAPRIIAGTMAATIALTAGVAIATDGDQKPEDPKLDDVVLVRDVAQTEITSTTVTMPAADETMQSPFDTAMSIESGESVESIESAESVESMESIESAESVESMESVESAESVESIESVESAESVESMESVESAESVESIESVESADSADSADTP